MKPPRAISLQFVRRAAKDAGVPVAAVLARTNVDRDDVALHLLCELRARGFRPHVESGRLWVTAPSGSRLCDEDSELIRAVKPQLVELLLCEPNQGGKDDGSENISA